MGYPQVLKCLETKLKSMVLNRASLILKKKISFLSQVFISQRQRWDLPNNKLVFNLVSLPHYNIVLLRTQCYR